jgi:PhnB protein
MPKINVYLTFNGNCEEAFNFYKSVFGGEFPYLGRFKDMPPQPGQSVPQADANKIMHISLPIGNETILMGSDAGGDWGKNIQVGNNFSISLSADDKTQADNFFKKLLAGGTTKMPMADTFWGSYFGMLTDKFGINWMVSYDKPQQHQDKQNKSAAVNA